MTQRDTVLRMLREAGPKGVSSHVWNYEYGITRSAAVVHQLRGEGFNIETVDEGKLPDGRARMARYILHADTGPSKATAQATTGPFGGLSLGDAVDGLRKVAAAVASEPLVFSCGCVRSPDGTAWVAKCDRHAA